MQLSASRINQTGCQAIVSASAIFILGKSLLILHKKKRKNTMNWNVLPEVIIFRLKSDVMYTFIKILIVNEIGSLLS